MTFTSGIDIGSTYSKAVIMDEHFQMAGKALVRTGFRLAEAALQAQTAALVDAGLDGKQIEYTIATGFGRHQIQFADITATDITASARGCAFLFPETRTVLDVGGQTMKASLLDEVQHVKSFRLNDKCAAGTGAFLEKTARYMGFDTNEIGPLAATSKEPVPISGVCAVFAESEVINHLSQGHAPSDIMHGAILSLVDRSIQLMKRVRMEAEYTLIGGILRYETMGRVLREQMSSPVNIPDPDVVQFVSALGAALLAQQRLSKLRAGEIREHAHEQ
ncbi:MAG: 2-hydroxyglutaryl-CoA dehydratase [Chloroflexi bacterium]|nr:2-hydroxyglutaryl-CoA dehydratase [Chloroflexota bacterium]